MRKTTATRHTYGWTNQAAIKMIECFRPTVIGRDPLPALELKLVKAPAEAGVLNIVVQLDNDAQGMILMTGRNTSVINLVIFSEG